MITDNREDQFLHRTLINTKIITEEIKIIETGTNLWIAKTLVKFEVKETEMIGTQDLNHASNWFIEMKTNLRRQMRSYRLKLLLNSLRNTNTMKESLIIRIHNNNILLNSMNFEAVAVNPNHSIITKMTDDISILIRISLTLEDVDVVVVLVVVVGHLRKIITKTESKNTTDLMTNITNNKGETLHLEDLIEVHRHPKKSILKINRIIIKVKVKGRSLSWFKINKMNSILRIIQDLIKEVILINH